MTKHIATIKITLRDKDAWDGILERISDLGFHHGAESESSLIYTMEGDNLVQLRESVAAFRQALREFFQVTRITPSGLDTTYREAA